MDISYRLKTVAKQVKTGYRLADIGTDHGYVPIYLYKQGVIKSAVACDINKAPLGRANENIMRYKLCDVITVRLGSGLEPITPNEVEVAVIAGMGGMLIIDILKNSSETVNSLKQLVLQPQLDIPAVRKYIHSIGFKIENEEMIIENGKFYNVLSVVYGKDLVYNEYEYLFGKILIEKKSSVLKSYVEHKISKFDDIVINLKKAESHNSYAKLQEVLEEMKMFLEVLKWL